jgi:hypothetical protein
MQLAIASLVSGAAGIMESRQERGKFIEVLQARDVFFTDFLTFLSSHAGDYARQRGSRNTTFGLYAEISNTRSNHRAEQYWDWLRRLDQSPFRKTASLATVPVPNGTVTSEAISCAVVA